MFKMTETNKKTSK